jgi:hypothetical protein
MMGKRGSKPKFTDGSCPNQDCKFYGIYRKGNIIGNGTYQIKNKRIRKYICRIHGRVFNDLTNTFFPKTGKIGRPKKPTLLSNKDLKYAQVVKNKQ